MILHHNNEILFRPYVQLNTINIHKKIALQVVSINVSINTAKKQHDNNNRSHFYQHATEESQYELGDGM